MKKQKRISKGEIKTIGKFEVVTRSHKSTPGDGTHGNGTKGGGHDVCFLYG